MALITLAQTEKILVLRQGPALVACSVATSGNPLADATPRLYLQDCVGFAIREQGAAMVDPTAPQDADLAAITDLDRLFDIAELRLMESLCAAFAQVTWSTATQKQDLNAYRVDLLKQIDTKRAYCKDRYGFGRGKIGLATINMGFGSRLPYCDDGAGWAGW